MKQYSIPIKDINNGWTLEVNKGHVVITTKGN